jgi:hypothetical protein
VVCAALGHEAFTTGGQQHPRHRVFAACPQPPLDSSLAPHSLGAHQGGGPDWLSIPLSWEKDSGRGPDRGGGHWHTEGQFCSAGDSGRGSWVVSLECGIMSFTKPPHRVGLLGEPGLTKALEETGRDCPGAGLGPLPEEAWQTLLMPVSRGDGRPQASLPEDVGLWPPQEVPSSAQWALMQPGSNLQSHHPRPGLFLCFLGLLCPKHIKNLPECQELC